MFIVLFYYKIMEGIVDRLRYWLYRCLYQLCKKYFAWELSTARKAGWKVGYDLGYEDSKAGRDRLVPPLGGE